jgi:hypothetical protein
MFVLVYNGFNCDNTHYNVPLTIYVSDNFIVCSVTLEKISLFNTENTKSIKDGVWAPSR